MSNTSTNEAISTVLRASMRRPDLRTLLVRASAGTYSVSG